jgi:tetratricopeptide (TPR) repeat protein
MRFGKIYMLGQIQNYEEYTKEIMKTIIFADSINYNWKWSYNEPKENAKQFFLETIQEYVNTIYNTRNNELLIDMREIAETVLMYNPDHVASLSNIAITYMVSKKYDKGLQYLLRAEKIAPDDLIVLNNIAVIYKRKGDKRRARKYYEKIIEVGNVQEVQSAKENIKEL